MHASTSENNVLFKRKTALTFVELKHFKMIALKDDLISEACRDSSGENDAILKKIDFHS